MRSRSLLSVLALVGILAAAAPLAASRSADNVPTMASEPLLPPVAPVASFDLTAFEALTISAADSVAVSADLLGSDAIAGAPSFVLSTPKRQRARPAYNVSTAASTSTPDQYASQRKPRHYLRS